MTELEEKKLQLAKIKQQGDLLRVLFSASDFNWAAADRLAKRIAEVDYAQAQLEREIAALMVSKKEGDK